ncbi:MAG: rod shape-determining protein RodA [Alcaligenaceae bacterium]|nr:rod shape-determining protein RodA [Alcaligenaceae bacterium]
MTKLFNWIVYALKSIDWMLLFILCLLASVGLVTMFSAVGYAGGRFTSQIYNFVLAFFIMWFVSMLPLSLIRKVSPILFLGSVMLLLGVAFFGITQKGATRWLNVGVTTIQPSELLKLTLPLMMAWYFDRRRQNIQWFDYVVGIVFILIPFILIIKQPDLGTGLLVACMGLFVLYFAGFSFLLIVPAVLVVSIGIGLIIYYEPVLCSDGVDWVVLHEYQRQRVCTLLDPMNDPLGRGFHIIQSIIAIGSGGLYGKGYMSGTQAHLDFVPERTTDFIFAVYAEEFGLYGAVLLILIYTLLIVRGLFIVLKAKTEFARLLSGAMTMQFFAYAFVNMGMVMGILPVVGVPLPLMSYGGTALVTLGLAAGLLMNVSHYVPQKPNSTKQEVIVRHHRT